MVNRAMESKNTVRMKLSPQGRALLEKPIVAQIVNKSSAFYVNLQFINVFTRIHHWSLSRAR